MKKNVAILMPVKLKNGWYMLQDKNGRVFKCNKKGCNNPDDFIKINIKRKKAIRVTETKNGILTYRACDLKEFKKAEPVTEEFKKLLMLEVKEKASGKTTKTATINNDIINFLNKSINLKPKKLKINPIKWKYLVRSVLRGKNILMVGPAGCGKTFAVQSLSAAFPERKFFTFNLGSTQDPRATLIGNTHFSKENGTFFAESAFVKAIQTENAIIMLDELSRAHPEAMNILMTVLDENQKYLRLDEEVGSPTIKVANGVSFIATANIGNEYTSARVLDRALLDRFVIIEMEPLTANDEKALLKEMYPELSDSKILAISEIAEATRKEIKTDAPKISTIISTRATVEIAGLLNDGFSLIEAAEVAIFPFFPEEGGIDSERTFIKQIVQKYLDTDVDEDADGDLFNLKKEDITELSNNAPF